MTAQYRVPFRNCTAEARQAFHVPACGRMSRQETNRRRGRDLASVYKASRTSEAVLLRPMKTLSRVIEPDAFALCANACARPAVVVVARWTASLPANPPASAMAGAGGPAMAIRTAHTTPTPTGAATKERRN